MRPDDLALHLGAGAGGVRADQGALQPGAQLLGDVPGGQRAEAGRDAVGGGRPAARASTAPRDWRHRLERRVGQLDRGAVARDRDDLGERQRLRADRNGVIPPW